MSCTDRAVHKLSVINEDIKIELRTTINKYQFFHPSVSDWLDIYNTFIKKKIIEDTFHQSPSQIKTTDQCQIQEVNNQVEK